MASASTTITAEREHYLNADYGFRSWLLTTDHKRIALLYMVSITVFFFVGGAAATSSPRPTTTTGCSPCTAW